MMRQFSREACETLHRNMWNWIADEIEKNDFCPTGEEYIIDLKRHYLYVISGLDDGAFLYACPACQYGYEIEKSSVLMCKGCLVVWPSYVETFMCLDSMKRGDNGGLFMKLCFEKDIQKKSRLARQIANLPLRSNSGTRNEINRFAQTEEFHANEIE